MIIKRFSQSRLRTSGTVIISSTQSPTAMDKPIYFPHRTIPRQLQGAVCKCIKNWLLQGVISPSSSPYASQVAIVYKKTAEVCLCVDYRKLNSITIRDIFPLPHIDETL